MGLYVTFYLYNKDEKTRVLLRSYGRNHIMYEAFETVLEKSVLTKIGAPELAGAEEVLNELKSQYSDSMREGKERLDLICKFNDSANAKLDLICEEQAHLREVEGLVAEVEEGLSILQFLKSVAEEHDYIQPEFQLYADID